MQYCMTMEQTRRIAVFFDSDDDEAAIEKANQILKETPSEDYESGDKEYVSLQRQPVRLVLDKSVSTNSAIKNKS